MLATKLLEAAGNSTQPVYIEDVFSTYLYNAGSPKTIVNGIDLAGKGGMVWTKWRSDVYGAIANGFWDTARGVKKKLVCPSTAGQYTYSTDGVTSFNSDGFNAVATTETYDATAPDANALFASWTFRQQDKFFKVVTWTGNGATPRTITHNLGSVPGCIIVKKYIGTAEEWFVFHRSMGNNGTTQYFCILNSNAAQDTGGYGMEKASSWTSTTFSLVSAGGSALNESGATYVAYVFAHNAGGFGLTGTDNVISCGSVTSSASGPVEVTLGYEPQWILYKQSNAVSDWYITDNMRGWTASYQEQLLRPNNSTAESAGGNMRPTATGFSINPGGAVNWIYIAIRRGPMKVPTDATKVFSPQAVTPTSSSTFTTGFPFDSSLFGWRQGDDGGNWTFVDRLRGYANTSGDTAPVLRTSSTSAEFGSSAAFYGTNNTGGVWGGAYAGLSDIFYFLRRAPGFFDAVCDTGTGASHTITHGLTVSPELLIRKQRSGVNNWCVYTSALGNTKVLNLESTGSPYTDANAWNSTSPTSSVFSVGTSGETNTSGGTFVTYLFASCPGVSKVGSYTGTGATQTINCGFTGGARFVLIKRTDSTGDWYVWDTARGIVSGNDSYLLMNSSAAEVTTTDYIDPVSSGFEISSAAPAAINASGGTYIYLAIA